MSRGIISDGWKRKWLGKKHGPPFQTGYGLFRSGLHLHFTNRVSLSLSHKAPVVVESRLSLSHTKLRTKLNCPTQSLTSILLVPHLDSVFYETIKIFVEKEVGGCDDDRAHNVFGKNMQAFILAVCLHFLGFQLVQLSSVFVSKLTSSSVRQMCHGLIYTNLARICGGGQYLTMVETRQNYIFLL